MMTDFAKIRRRAQLYIRLWEGIKKILIPPFLVLLPLAFLIVLFCVALNNRALPIDVNIPAMLYQIYDYIKIGALSLVFLVVLLGLLVFLGTPHYRWRTAEEVTMNAFHLESLPHKCPVLMSCKRVKGSARRWEFYSPLVEMSEWVKCQTAIEDALNCHLVEPIQYGGRNNNDRRRIVLYTASGAKSVGRGVLHDEQL